MKRGEGTEDHWRGSESGSVQVDTEELIDCGKTSGRALHGVVGRSEAVHVFVPRRRAREEELNHDTSQVHVAKGSCESGRGSGRTEEEHETRTDERGTKMGDTVRQPGEDIEDDGLVSREDVTQVCTVEDVFEGGQHADPDRRSVFAVDESVKVVLAERIGEKMVRDGSERDWRGEVGRKENGERKSYWQEKKKTSHAAIGKNGRKNWRVMGSSSDSINRVATAVLTMGPGDWMTQRAKMPTTARKRY